MLLKRLSFAFVLGRRFSSTSTKSTTTTKKIPQTPDSLLLSGGSLNKLLLPLPDAPKLSSHQAVYKAPVNTATSKWTPSLQRTGVLGFKAGMTADWDVWGVRKTLTCIQLDDVVVTGIRTVELHGYSALQIGAREPKSQRVSRADAGFFRKSDIAPRSHLGEFRVSPEAVLPIGTSLTSRHFVPGQCVKVTGTTQGKGFQGAMKRHHFAGQGASHGNSLSHRALGATGSRQDPGKVMKGKKMPGQMGGDTVTVDGLQVYKIDIRRNLIYVIGSVPGKPGTLLRITDSLKAPFPSPPPFPTYSLSETDLADLAKWAAGAFLPPAEEAFLAQQGLLPTGYAREPPFELLAAPTEIDPFSIQENDEPEAA